jgi:hypothetical protein
VKRQANGNGNGNGNGSHRRRPMTRRPQVADGLAPEVPEPPSLTPEENPAPPSGGAVAGGRSGQ